MWYEWFPTYRSSEHDASVPVPGRQRTTYLSTSYSIVFVMGLIEWKGSTPDKNLTFMCDLRSFLTPTSLSEPQLKTNFSSTCTPSHHQINSTKCRFNCNNVPTSQTHFCTTIFQATTSTTKNTNGTVIGSHKSQNTNRKFPVQVSTIRSTMCTVYNLVGIRVYCSFWGWEDRGRLL